jgi:hypothetical protein
MRRQPFGLHPQEPCSSCGQRHGRSVICSPEVLAQRRFADALQADSGAVDRSEAAAMARYARRTP